MNDIDVEKANHNLKEVVKKSFHEYCDTSTIHGVKYIGERKRIERFLWTLIWFLLVCGCGTQIYEIVGKWRQNPLVFLLDQKMSPISEIPFPAVTLCPQRLPNRNKFNYTSFLYRFLHDKDRNFSREELKQFDVVSKICQRRFFKYIPTFMPFLDDIPDFSNEDLLDVMEDLLLSHYLKLHFCKGIIPNVSGWECNLRFTRVWLQDGICYSFNMKPKDQIFRPDVDFPLATKPNLVFPKDEPGKTYAEEVFANIGDQEGPYHVKTRRDRLFVRTRLYEDFTDPTCHPDFFVFIHNPDEIPWDRQSDGHLIQVEEFVKNVLTITPAVIRTDPELQTAFSIEERGCYFEDEHELKFFRKYTQNNCELECMANASAHPDNVNCTLFWMPRMPDMPLCGFGSYLVLLVLNLDQAECNCLPNCNTVDYSIQISSSHTPNFDDSSFTKDDFAEEDNYFVGIFGEDQEQKFYLALNKTYNFEIPLGEAINQTNLTMDFDVWKWKFSEIEIHFEDSNFLAMRRHLAYSFADFVSQVGGILGCFLGISIFSIIEIVYFCTVRMLKGLKGVKKGRKKRDRQPPQRQIQIKTVRPATMFVSSEKY